MRSISHQINVYSESHISWLLFHVTGFRQPGKNSSRLSFGRGSWNSLSLLWGFQKKFLTITLGLQFTLAVEHWIKMDVAEILQGKCVCTDAKWVVVGIRSAHPLSWPWSHHHPQAAWVANWPWQLAAAGLFCWWGIPRTVSIWTPRDSRRELGCACLHLPPSREVARVASSSAEGRAAMKL